MTITVKIIDSQRCISWTRLLQFNEAFRSMILSRRKHPFGHLNAELLRMSRVDSLPAVELS